LLCAVPLTHFMPAPVSAPTPDPTIATATAPLAVHHDPEFRRLWTAGLLGSLVRWLEILVFGVFTYQQTQSAFWVASMTMLRMLPLALFGVLLGAVSMRTSRRRGLLVGNAVLLVTSLVLCTVAAYGALAVWHLALASFIGGLAWAADTPMRRGLMGDVVGAARMGQAMALDAVATNGSRLAGPGLGGVLLAHGGMALVFLFCALLYVPVLAALARLPEHHTARAALQPLPTSRLLDGFRAARDSPALAATLWVTVVFNLFCWPVLSMVPVIGAERLQLSTQSIGLLASMDGIGALLGALGLALLARRWRYGSVYVGGLLLFLAALPVFALSAHPLLTGAALVLMGLGQAGFAVMQSTLVFIAAPPSRRMGAMGLLTMCVGMAPVGFLLVGWLAERLGAPTAAVTCSLSGFVVMALSVRWWRACLHASEAMPARDTAAGLRAPGR
jgi:MFS family permease